MPFCILHRPTKLLVRLQDATKNSWDAKLPAEAEKPAFRIEPLGLKHDRAAFSCGVDLLDVYLRKQAVQDFKKHAGVPFVLTPDGSTIAGYYTLSQYAMGFSNCLMCGFNRATVPIGRNLLSRFAI
jgi:hypothetical protein